MAIPENERQSLLKFNKRRINRIEDSYGTIGENYYHESLKPPTPDGGDALTSCILIACVACTTALSSLVNGMVVVAIPRMAKDLSIPPNLVLWPASIHALTSGCTLLICGSIADVLGSRPIYLLGSSLQFLFTLGCGLSRSSTELIVSRALAGVAASFCLPSAVALINGSFPKKRWRGYAFACMGGGQPVGFAIGLVAGGVSSGTIGWQWGFHICSIINFVMILIAAWKLPKNALISPNVSWKRLGSDIDWIGALIASTSLAMIFYALAIIADESSTKLCASNIILITTGILLLPLFILHIQRQTRLSRPALIPNSLWYNRVFTSVCINVFLTWGSFNALEQFLNLFFQEVQYSDGLATAIKFLPTSISGLMASVFMGCFVHRLRGNYIIFGGVLVSALSPFLLANIEPDMSYWYCAFPAIVLNPLGVDALFTISILLISSVFDENMQGLAGGVFNTVSSIGKSIGLAVAASIANNVASHVNDGGDGNGGKSIDALMKGYRAAFWFCFVSVILTLGVSAFGLRGVGKVGSESKANENTAADGEQGE